MADARHRDPRQAFVEDILATIRVDEYDLDVARAHAVLMAHTRRTGSARGAHDLIIAATALSRGRIVLTTDVSGFGDLPGVTVRVTSAKR